MYKRTNSHFVADILLSAIKLRQIIARVDNAQQLAADYILFDAAIRELQIVGDATNTLIKAGMIDRSYQIVVDFRNKITHEYFGINIDIVWDVVISEIPDFIQYLELDVIPLKCEKNDLVDALECSIKDCEKMHQHEIGNMLNSYTDSLRGKSKISIADNWHHKAEISATDSINSKGFTLVELAVVLVILGSLFTAVLKVESMVKNAKTRQLFNQYRELRTAILVYKDKYGYLPGDDPKADVHVGATHVGNSDGRIDFPVTYENSALFEHLGKAGLIKGLYNGNPSATQPLFAATPMDHPFTAALPQVPSYVLINYDTGENSNIIQFLNLPYEAAQALDMTFDDGIYNTGNVKSARDYSALATKDAVTTAYGISPAGSARGTWMKIY